jgi:hypothetical protein
MRPTWKNDRMSDYVNNIWVAVLMMSVTPVMFSRRAHFGFGDAFRRTLEITLIIGMAIHGGAALTGCEVVLP